jgi:hypothetical protein
MASPSDKARGKNNANNGEKSAMASEILDTSVKVNYFSVICRQWQSM